MITYLYVNNYKSFVNFRIDFGRLNLLLGKNGAGKSNVFMLIASVRDLILGRNQVLVQCFSSATLTRWHKSGIQSFELGIEAADKKYVYSLDIRHDTDNGMPAMESEKLVCNDKLLYNMDNGNAIVYDDLSRGTKVLTDETISGISFVPQGKDYSLLRGFKDEITKILICTPNPKSMQDIALNDVYGPMSDFSNIASVYAGLMLLDPEIYSNLAKKMKSINPDFHKARTSVEEYAKYLTVDFKYKDTVSSYHFNELSDGEKMLFALYMLLFGYIKRGLTVLIDEPDNYLSLREIQPWCIDIEDEIGDEGQCLMISHHPEVIDYMAETRGIWMGRLRSGESKILGKPDIEANERLLTYSQMIARGLLDEAE